VEHSGIFLALVFNIVKKILLVDDHKVFLNTLSEELREYRADWSILTAENGRQGAELIDSQVIDLVVTDLKMPVMDGYELLAYIREKRPNMPIIVMTADYTHAIEKRLHSLGVEQCVSKPFIFSEIARTISSRLA
jgi:CheY-like chemotaxis protein